MKSFKDKKTLGLTLAILAILLASTAALFVQFRSSSQDKTTHKTAALYQNGQLLRRIPLKPGAEDTFTVESGKDGFNTIQIVNGKVGIVDANCPDRLCVKMGMISSSAYPISCLPHKLVIQIENSENSKEEPPVDALTQ
ncbi:MAG: NusG domain II-containing protein [Lachnospiraceae bacterium]|nr:NusG domain II-containing protein [Lachnospiraceae bacterium]